MRVLITDYRAQLERILRENLPDLRDRLKIAFQETETPGHLVAHLRWGRVDDAVLALEVKESAITSNLQWRRSRILHDSEATKRRAIPVIAAPYVGDTTARLIMESKLGYFDLAGNCALAFGPFVIVRRDRKNPFPERHPQRSIFAAKATRVIRALLAEPHKKWPVTSIAKAVDVSAGYAYKVLARLRELDYVSQEGEEYRLSQGRELLLEWAKSHRFADRDRLRRFVLLGDPGLVESRFCEVANRENVRYALTLFAAAGHRALFVRYPVVHAYIDGDVDTIAHRLDAREVGEGGNLVLVLPRDVGVFFDVQRIPVQQAGGDRIVDRRAVCDVQLFVDLYNFEARGREQAEFLLQSCLPHFQGKGAPESEAAFHNALNVRDQADTAFIEKKYRSATELYERFLASMAGSNHDLAERERLRGQLLLWMSLVHSGFELKDMQKIETARRICVTDIEVGHLRNRVGYNRGFIELALLAYYAALHLLTTDDMEKKRYWLKAKTHYDILSSRYMESGRELAEDAARIWEQLPPVPKE